MCQHTTVCFITAILAVSFPVTKEGFRNAAVVFITLVIAALHLKTFEFIRAVLAVRHAITHLVLLNAPLPMCTLELVCRRKSHDRSSGRTGPNFEDDC